jgi:hypothetical protein
MVLAIETRAAAYLFVVERAACSSDPPLTPSG